MDFDSIKKLSFELLHIEDILREKLGLSPMDLKSEEFQRTHDALQDRWYASYDPSGDPRGQNYDYGVYADPLYPHLMLDCYRGWSRSNVVNTVKFFQDLKQRGLMKHDPASVLDVFAGTGQTTIVLSKAFPSADVLYHNSDPAQIEVMRELMKRYNAHNIHIVSEPTTAEVVFAMEAIEHVLDPMSFVRPILEPATCKFYIDGSSFTIDSIGHFKHYMDGERKIVNKDYKRFFFDSLKKLGYHQCFDMKRWVHKRFYNGRPNVLVREGAVATQNLKGNK